MTRYQICFYAPDPFRGDRYALGARIRAPLGVVWFVPFSTGNIPTQHKWVATNYRASLKVRPLEVPGPLFDVFRWRDVPNEAEDPTAWVRSIDEGPK